MRQTLGNKRLQAINSRLDRVFVTGQVRGGTGHRIDLWTEDGHLWSYWRWKSSLPASPRHQDLLQHASYCPACHHRGTPVPS